jgi:hypothetical protein
MVSAEIGSVKAFPTSPHRAQASEDRSSQIRDRSRVPAVYARRLR